MLTLDRATNSRAHRAAVTTAMRDDYLNMARDRAARARSGNLTPLPHDHPDALLAAAGRTDANGYRYDTVTRHHDDGRVTVRYVAPLRIGGPAILHPDGSGPILRAEYRRRDRASLVAAAVRRDALRHRAIAEDTIARITERLDGRDPFGVRFPRVQVPTTRAWQDDQGAWHGGDPAIGPIHLIRRAVPVMLADLQTAILTADRMARFCALETRRQHRAARVMVAPILRERDAARQAAKRAAMSDDDRKAASRAAAERRAARLAAMTPAERDAYNAERAAKARARRAQKGS